MASPHHPILPCPEASDSERPPPALTDDLLEEILLRVASPADLARASTACVSFRRLVTDPFFLRRYRSLHPPLLLGFVTTEGFDPVEAPHPNAPAGRALAHAADFSFGFLPLADWDTWDLCDVRDGRLLIELERFGDYMEVPFLSNFLVCDPLTQRYLLLPALPDDLPASVELLNENIFDSETFLIPCSGEDETFRVICITFNHTRLAAFVFSSGSGCWSLGTSTSWDALSLEEPEDANVMDPRHYAYGCFYWKVWDKLLKLDVNKMEFSADDLPPDHDRRTVAIVEAGEGKLGMFSLIYGGTSVDYYAFLQNGAERANEWLMKSTIPLPACHTCFISQSVEGHLFLQATLRDQDTEHSACFALEIETFNIETIRRQSSSFFLAYFGFPPSMSPNSFFPAYFGFPPSMSLRRIS